VAFSLVLCARWSAEATYRTIDAAFLLHVVAMRTKRVSIAANLKLVTIITCSPKATVRRYI
jgi:hypothetical protein